VDRSLSVKSGKDLRGATGHRRDRFATVARLAQRGNACTGGSGNLIPIDIRGREWLSEHAGVDEQHADAVTLDAVAHERNFISFGIERPE
jgi:hypothetical protein